MSNENQRKTTVERGGTKEGRATPSLSLMQARKTAVNFPRLGEKEDAFVFAIALGNDEETAVQIAGYSDQNTARTLKRLRENERVQDAIRILTAPDVLDKDEALAIMTEIARDPKVAPSVRLAAAQKAGEIEDDPIAGIGDVQINVIVNGRTVHTQKDKST